MLGNKKVSNKELEELVERCIQDLPERDACECRLGQRRKIAGNNFGIIASGMIGYILGIEHSLMSNLGEIARSDNNYLSDLTSWEILTESVKYFAYAQPEAVTYAFIMGTVAYKLFKKDYMNYNKKILEKYSKS